MPGVSRPRLITKPFLAVTAATGAFFVYVGMLVPLLPTFIEDELGAGELGIGLTIAAFALAAIVARPLIARLIERYGRRRRDDRRVPARRRRRVLCATVDSLPPLLALRGVTGIGEAALFVAAATLVADLAPPDRRAEAASYFSVAVFGGIGIGPIIGEAVLQDDRFHLAFLVAAASGPRRRDGARRAAPRARPVRRRRPRAAAEYRGFDSSCTPPRSAPGSCWRPASPRSPCSRRSCPSTPARSGSPGPAACSPPTASSASCCASSAPACPSGSAPAGPSRSRSSRWPPRSARWPRSRPRGRCGRRPSSSASGWRSCTRR